MAVNGTASGTNVEQYTGVSMGNYAKWQIAPTSHFTTGGLANPSVMLKLESSFTGVWETRLKQSISSWHSANAGVGITYTYASSSHKIEVVNKPNVLWSGWCSQTLFLGNTTSSMISMNAAKTHTNNEWIGIISHEIGHLFSLKDDPTNDTFPNNSIMNYDCDLNSNYNPRALDAYNVRFKYD